jgi:hypothetical protein
MLLDRANKLVTALSRRGRKRLSSPVFAIPQKQKQLAVATLAFWVYSPSGAGLLLPGNEHIYGDGLQGENFNAATRGQLDGQINIDRRHPRITL